MTTLAAGLHDISCELYEQDPCEAPSLRSSGIKQLLSDSPAEFMANHPKLTQWPEMAKKSTKRQDEGSVAHSMILGKGYEFVVKSPSEFLTDKGKPCETWGCKAAAAWKAEQEARGLIVIDSETNAQAEATRNAVVKLCIEEYGDWPIGDSEVSIVWTRETEHGAIWCRARLDHLAFRHAVVLDLKTTELSISDRAIQKAAAQNLWHIQAAWALSGMTNLYPELAGKLTFRFPVVQSRPPFDARFWDPPESWLSIAAQRCDRAAELFGKCLAEDEWPGQPKVSRVEPPSWLIAEFENDEMV